MSISIWAFQPRACCCRRSKSGICIGAFDKEPIRREFGLDAEPLLILALGKGIEKIELTEIGSDGDRAYYRKNGTHYVPKVRLEDLLIG